MEKWYNINASAGIPIVTIYGYLVDTQYSPDDVTFTSFIEDIDYLVASKPKIIFIKLNTGGGNVAVGFAIYDYIENKVKPQGIKIITEDVGMAASMGSIIFMCGDERLINPNSRVMIHRPKGGIYGDADEMAAYVDLLKTYEEQAIDVYMKSGQTKEVVLSWLKSGVDKWFTAKECVKLGIATSIVGGNKTTMTMKFNNQEEAWSHYQSINLSLTKNIKKMAFTKEFLMSLGLPEDATEQQVQDAVTKMQSANQVSAKAVEDANKAAQAALDMSIKTMIDTAIKEGKMIEAQREGVEVIAKASGLDKAKAYLDTLKPVVTPNQMINQSAHNTTPIVGRENWTYKDWMKKDSPGLMSMKVNEPDKFNQLLNNHKSAVNSKYKIG